MTEHPPHAGSAPIGSRPGGAMPSGAIPSGAIPSGAIPGPPSAPAWRRAVVDGLVRGGAVVVSLWGAGLLAAYGAFLTPLRVGQALVPVSVLIALGANAALAWFAYVTTRNRLLGLLPGLVWVVLTITWSARSTEGDVVLANTWVSTLYVFLGAAPTVVAAYRWFLAQPARPPALDRRG